MVVVVEVPVIWEVPPRWGFVAVTAGAAGFVGLVGFGLVFQCYDTTGSSGQQESGGACAILGMTLSRVDLMFSRLFRVEKCSATQGDSLVT